MSIKVKSGGAYADITGVFHKRAGAYEAVQGVFVKAGGVYGRVDAALPPFNPERPIPLNLMNSGASHTNNFMPTYIDAMAEYFGTPGDVTTGISIINGSTWAYRWGNDTSAQGGSARQAVEAGTPDVLAICDNSSSAFDADVSAYGALWRDACEENSVEMFVWSLQSVGGEGLEDYIDPLDVPDSVWEAVRDRQETRNSQWKELVSYLRNTSSDPLAPPVRFIPWAAILGKIIDGWLSGSAPAGFRPEQMLGDGRVATPPVVWYDNHPSALGRWCIALAHFAVIWRRDPTLVPLPGVLGISTEDGLTNGQPRNAILGTTTSETYAWLASIVWNECQMEPLSEVRQWSTTPDFLLFSTERGQVEFYRAPTLDPADLPVVFDAALRLEGDITDGDVQTGLTSVPVTWTGLDTGDYQARRHPDGAWSPAIHVQRVIPAVIDIVAEMELSNLTPGTTIVSDWRQFTTLPAGTEIGDIAIWVAICSNSNATLAFSSSTTSLFPTQFSQGISAGGGALNSSVHILAGTVASLTGTFQFGRFQNGGGQFLGALLILRGADLSTLEISEWDNAPADTNAYIEAPALTAGTDSSLDIILTRAQQSNGLNLLDISGYTNVARYSSSIIQSMVARSLTDAGPMDRPLIRFPGAQEATVLRALRLAIGIA